MALSVDSEQLNCGKSIYATMRRQSHRNATCRSVDPTYSDDGCQHSHVEYNTSDADNDQCWKDLSELVGHLYDF